MNETLLAKEHFESDARFDSLYPEEMQQLSGKHWTPISIAKKAAQFLTEDSGASILDIGSGIGKFCLVGAYFQSDNHFFGIEQRDSLVALAGKAKIETGVENVTFLRGNFTTQELNKYDHFYFYNSFYENLVDEDLYIDDSVDHSLDLYEHYSQYLYQALDQKPRGTRLSTYHGFREIVPRSYRLMESFHDGFLRHWIKK
jgi:SAM-dependent methyltransferase